MTEKEIEELKRTIQEAEELLKKETELTELREKLYKVHYEPYIGQYQSEYKIDIILTDDESRKIASLEQYLDYYSFNSIKNCLCKILDQNISEYQQKRANIKFYKRRPTKK